METTYSLGIDGGGTKCKARLENEEGLGLGEGLSGPANPVLGLELAIDSITEAGATILARQLFQNNQTFLSLK